MKKKRRHPPPKWSKLNKDNLEPLQPEAGSWPMYYFRRNLLGQITDLNGKLVHFKIKNPYFIDFMESEIEIVKNTLNKLTNQERDIAKYYSFGPPTKQWTPVIDRLIDTYEVTPVHTARIIAITQAAINDAMVITWRIKYLTDIARPNQIEPSLKIVIPTPAFPAYPSGHATMSGCAEVILSYFFPKEATRLKEIAEENAYSRLLGGVHFKADNDEGLRLGRQIGKHILNYVRRQRDAARNFIDKPFVENKNAILPPPPYEQIIPFPPLKAWHE
ncbi:vanadium-dependent haloperoxidase [Salipaludibacillus daqingensis]|uniref:vanadium-dependent haloperoxidase n=1 Tax=Salipaludibacillus daqingensis TaxID=3041001 RepID=UPI00247488AA|nr:vanadium-dependent haloperoxidase [Salipaludibacillus daqingensis]